MPASRRSTRFAKRMGEAPRRTYDGDRVAWDAVLANTGVPGWDDELPGWEPGQKVATRKASGEVFESLVDKVPGLMGGAADLTGNTGTSMGEGVAVLSAKERDGRQIHFGIREHGMGAAMNGMAGHGGVIPVGGTFFVFSDYMRPAVRLACIAEHQVIYSWTHDSVGVGEDGPTHQPVEQLAAMRAMPGLRVVRPADANETVTAWRDALEHRGPTALILTRQGVPVLEGTAGNDGVSFGAYVLAERSVGPDELPDITLVGTGSEVWVCLDAADVLAEDGLRVRVVSMPCWEDFDAQDESYQAEVLPGEVPTLSVEAAVSFGWDRWADDSVSIERFGASAPGGTVLNELGINPVHVVERARALLDEIDDPEETP